MCSYDKPELCKLGSQLGRHCHQPKGQRKTIGGGWLLFLTSDAKIHPHLLSWSTKFVHSVMPIWLFVMCFFIVYCIFFTKRHFSRSSLACSISPLACPLPSQLLQLFGLAWLGFYVSNGLMADRWIHLLATSIYMLVGESIPVVAHVFGTERLMQSNAIN